MLERNAADVFSPGHTYGHCALNLPERGALISGDAIVTLDPYTRVNKFASAGVRPPATGRSSATPDRKDQR
jgi:glyoxylase-like metal-dependent hydrolase (beta-lactamase superfamily II)